MIANYETLEPRNLLAATAFGDFNADGFVDAADYVAWRAAPAIGDYDAFVANFGRELNWFHLGAQDAALAELGGNLLADGSLSREDILELFNSAKDGGSVDAAELADLRQVASSPEMFARFVDVALTTYVVEASPANKNFQGQPLGNLHADATAEHLTKLVDKWFLGLDRPATSGTYQPASGQLFVDGPQYSDVRQGTVGTCYLLAALAETADNRPADIESLFTINGDGTYTVEWHKEGGSDYVTVDSYLPTDANGRFIYANYGSHFADANELWVALAEKAYAQLNEFGWSRVGFATSGQNNYSGIDSGWCYAALGHVTGQPTTAFNFLGQGFENFVNAFNAGELICFATFAVPGTPGIVPNHAYAVVSYNPDDETLTLFNPWGIQYGLVTMGWEQMKTNFMYFDKAA